MNILINIVARILFVIPFAAIGMGHFMNASEMAEMMIPNLPGNTILVYLTGVALIAAAISILTKKMAPLATLLLGVMLLSFVFIIHLPALDRHFTRSHWPKRQAGCSISTHLIRSP